MIKEKKKKRKRSLEDVPEDAPLDDPEGEIQVEVDRLRKKKPRKNVLPPSTAEVSTTMRDTEEDPEDMIPLSRRTRVARAALEEKRTVSRATPPPMTEENPIEVEEPAEVEVHEE